MLSSIAVIGEKVFDQDFPRIEVLFHVCYHLLSLLLSLQLQLFHFRCVHFVLLLLLKSHLLSLLDLLQLFLPIFVAPVAPLVDVKLQHCLLHCDYEVNVEIRLLLLLLVQRRRIVLQLLLKSDRPLQLVLLLIHMLAHFEALGD